MPPTQEQDPKTGKFVKTADQEIKEGDKPIVETEAIRQFSQRMLTGEPLKLDEKAGKEDDKSKAGGEKPKPEPKPAVKKKVIAVKSPAQPDPLATGAEAITKAAEALTKLADSNRPKPDTKTEDEEAALPADLQRKLRILEHMEKGNPDKYKDIAKKFKDGQAALASYVKDWKSKNPGKEYDPEDSEHESFYAEHDVDWDDDDYVESLADMKAEVKSKAAVEATEKERNERLSKLERSEKLRTSAPIIDKEQINAAASLWKHFGKDFEDIVKEDGSVDNAKIAELYKADPVGTTIRVNTARRVDALVAETYKLLHGLVDFDEQNAAHRYLNDFALEKERELMSQPVEDRLDAAGKPFMPQTAYNKLSPEKRKDHWTFTVKDLSTLLAHGEAENATAAIAEKERDAEQIAVSRGWKKPASQKSDEDPDVEKTGNEGGGKDDEPPDDPDEKPKSPSTVSQPKVAAKAGGAGTGGKEPLETFNDRFLGKS